jgi:hypothetical protein
MLEKTLLTAAFVRPFRCVECGWRFLRPSLRVSFETQQAVFSSRMTPKSFGKGAEPKKAKRGEAVRLNLDLG